MQSQKKQFVIIGLGKSGVSCARYLKRNNIAFSIFDTRAEPPGLADFKNEFPDVPLYLENCAAEIFTQASELIVSPGVALETPVIAKAINAGVHAIGDIELFARAAQAPIVAITGTNAKGTVTTLVGNMAKNAGLNVQVGGNIGTPALELLQNEKPDLYVLEISSFQLDTTYSLKTAAAAVLNITEDHLDRHGTMANYIAAKQRIYQQTNCAVWNREDAHTRPPAAITKQFTFGLTVPARGEFGIVQAEQQAWLAYDNQKLMPVKELLIIGQHNWSNALAALALGTAIQLPLPAMLQTLRTFKGLSHRCEWVAEYNGVTWYDDSKGTNVGATIAAIEGLGAVTRGKLILIAGGIDKGADFTQLQPAVDKFVKAVVLFGQDAHLIEKGLANRVPIHHAKNLAEAVTLAAQQAKAADAVVLSPLCTSFDMFRNAEDRGDQFKEWVKKNGSA